MLAAVVFDLDGVLLDTEEIWDEVREALVGERGGRWSGRAQADMMGMSSREWSRYMHDELGLAEAPEEISAEVVGRMLERYRRRLPLIDGALAAVERLAARCPLALASSSNRELIDTFVQETALEQIFRVTVSSEEVGRGKPAPDVFLEAARLLGVDPRSCTAVEDSSSGLLAARAGGMRVVAIPNRAFPPSEEALAAADVVLERVGELTAAVVEHP